MVYPHIGVNLAWKDVCTWTQYDGIQIKMYLNSYIYKV